MEIRDFELKEIVNYLLSSGKSIENYKPDFLKRRIFARMALTKSANPREYLARLKVDETEVRALVDSISINVSEFFRDPPVWEGVRMALKERLEEKAEAGVQPTLRIWSAGCSCGEEPYTVAMVALEVIKESGLPGAKVFIVATDIDRDALEKASAGVYQQAAIKGVPPHLAVKYLKRIQADRTEKTSRASCRPSELRSGSSDLCSSPNQQPTSFYSVTDEVKRDVKFRYHNIFTDPPIPLMDMVLCRNVLIYATPKMHKKAMEKLLWSITGRGFLVLGMNEVAFEISTMEPYMLRHRIYRKIR